MKLSGQKKTNSLGGAAAAGGGGLKGGPVGADAVLLWTHACRCRGLVFFSVGCGDSSVCAHLARSFRCSVFLFFRRMSGFLEDLRLFFSNCRGSAEAGEVTPQIVRYSGWKSVSGEVFAEATQQLFCLLSSTLWGDDGVATTAVAQHLTRRI